MPRHSFKLTAYWADDAFGRSITGAAPELVMISAKHFSYFVAAFTLHIKNLTHLVLPRRLVALRQALRFPILQSGEALPSAL